MNKTALFICAVGSMRLAQKEYFKSRDKKDLYRAWDCERAVDNMLTELLMTPGCENEKNTPYGSTEQPNPTEQTDTEESQEKPPF